LLDYSGNVRFATIGVFQPRDYLPEDSVATVMDADAITEISLKIAAPKTKVGGSTFDLIILMKKAHRAEGKKSNTLSLNNSSNLTST